MKSHHDPRRLAAAAVGAAFALGGCAAFNNVSSDVSSYSQWPAGRTASTYVFERLPSQQTRPESQQLLESAARRGLAAAGFTPAVDEQSADVTVQLSAHVQPDDRYPFDDPFWWHGGLYRGWYGHGGGYWGGHFGYGHRYWGGGWSDGYDSGTYDREVAMLIRDRKTGVPLYEAHASNGAVTPYLDNSLEAMYLAALKDFPNAEPKSHSVTVPLKATQ